MNIQHSTFNIQRLDAARRFFIGCWMFLFALLLVVGVPAFGQINSANTNEMSLAPPLGELPPAFWEQYGMAVLMAAIATLAVIGFVAWICSRPKARVTLTPETEARQALDALRSRPEDGALLSQLSQILRNYFITAFQLPAGELTTAEFCRMISRHEQIGPELATAVSDFLRECDERKFSPANSPAPMDALDKTLRLIAIAETRRVRVVEASMK